MDARACFDIPAGCKVVPMPHVDRAGNSMGTLAGKQFYQ